MTTSLASRSAGLLLCALFALVGCSGKSSGSPPSTPTSPTTSTSTTADPLVTIQATYNCHPCTNDPDNYAINVDCDGKGCGAIVHAPNPTVEHNTITFTGRLAPGSHSIEVVVHNVETSVAVSVNNAGGTGGVRPDSMRLQFSGTSAVDIVAPSRCGFVTTFRTRPTSTFESVFAFEVITGTPPSVC